VQPAPPQAEFQFTAEDREPLLLVWVGMAGRHLSPWGQNKLPDERGATSTGIPAKDRDPLAAERVLDDRWRPLLIFLSSRDPFRFC
jgi:hypothetical protein